MGKWRGSTCSSERAARRGGRPRLGKSKVKKEEENGFHKLNKRIEENEMQDDDDDNDVLTSPQRRRTNKQNKTQ